MEPVEAKFMINAGGVTEVAVKYLDIAERSGAQERALKLLEG